MNKNLFINYICEVNYPNSSAYSIHVLKMCDAFAEKNYKVNLFVPFSNKSFKKLTNDYNIKSKFSFIKIFRRKREINFFNRLLFSLEIIKKIDNININSLLISRSVIFAILASLYQKKLS